MANDFFCMFDSKAFATARAALVFSKLRFVHTSKNAFKNVLDDRADNSFAFDMISFAFDAVAFAFGAVVGPWLLLTV